MPSDDTRPRGRRRLSRQGSALGALAAAAGVLDAASYLGLGQVFTANMTGNTVLLGVALAQGSGGAALRSAVALAAFVAGVALGVFVGATVRRPSWALVSRLALPLELLALAALLAGWLALGTAGAGARVGLIALAALAMGLQSAAARAAGPQGVATTYVTGTLTNAIARAVGRRHWPCGDEGDEATSASASLPAAIWAVYALAAAAGAFAERAWHGSPVILALALVAAAFGVARRHAPALPGASD